MVRSSAQKVRSWLRLATMRAALEEIEAPRPALRRAPTPAEACAAVAQGKLAPLPRVFPPSAIQPRGWLEIGGMLSGDDRSDQANMLERAFEDGQRQGLAKGKDEMRVALKAEVQAAADAMTEARDDANALRHRVSDLTTQLHRIDPSGGLRIADLARQELAKADPTGTLKVLFG